MFFTALTVLAQRGGSLGMNGMTTLENFGLLLLLESLPPTRMATPLPTSSARGIAAHMVKQLPQNIQRSALTSRVLRPVSVFAGLMAAVGQAAIASGSSHSLSIHSMVDHGRLAVNSQDGYVRAVNCSAHVQAARQRDPDGGGEPHLPELIIKAVHYGLDHAGSIDRRGVAVSPALGMNDVGDTSAGSADRELV